MEHAAGWRRHVSEAAERRGSQVREHGVITVWIFRENWGPMRRGQVKPVEAKAMGMDRWRLGK